MNKENPYLSIRNSNHWTHLTASAIRISIHSYDSLMPHMSNAIATNAIVIRSHSSDGGIYSSFGLNSASTSLSLIGPRCISVYAA